MSYTLDLPCGCVAYVACDPASGLAHTRVIEARGLGCEVRRHEVGLKLYLWDLLPDRSRPERSRGEMRVKAHEPTSREPFRARRCTL